METTEIGIQRIKMNSLFDCVLLCVVLYGRYDVDDSHHQLRRATVRYTFKRVWALLIF